MLTGAALGGGLLVAWWAIPRDYPNPLEAAEGEHVFGAWLTIGEDSVVTVAVPQLEMGQGVTTLLPQIVARELGADWRQVAVEPAPPAAAYANIPLAENWIALWEPFVAGLDDSVDDWLADRYAAAKPFSATADGTAIAAFEAPCREAGAAARAMLAQEAAERWGTSWEECEVANGIVSWGSNTATFGELAGDAALRSPPDPPPLRPDVLEMTTPSPALTGRPSEEGAGEFPRIDLPSKVDGGHLFAGDVRLPEMVYAAIRHGPNNAAQLASFDEGGAAGIRGMVGAVKTRRWLAVAANTSWTAETAIEAMNPVFDATYPASSADIEQRLDLLVESGPSFLVAETGSGEEAMTRVDLARRYEIEPAHAAPLETATAVARYTPERLELWLASQAPEQARVAAARAVGLPLDAVALYPMAAGGSFDSRLENDHAIEVAHLAKTLGRPVQLSWSRRSEMIRSRPRSPYHVLIGSQVAPVSGGTIEAMRMRIACPPAAQEFGRRLFGNLTAWAAIRETSGMKDPMACEGAVPVYTVPSVAVRHVPVEIGLPVGRVRGNTHGPFAFAIESFIDEMASENLREPLTYRMSMLGSDVRLAACLQRAASMAQWDGGVNQSGQGIACYRIGDAETGARIACVATARREGGVGTGGVRVTQLAAAVDIGRIVNLDIARQQVEGGLVFGIGVALGNAVQMRAGLPDSFDYADLGLPTLADCPEMLVDFLPSDAPPADPGELGVVIAPPAIANALFSATGLRLRRLPLLSGGI
ncbi:MAG: molybdopterin cofactor-binding domain-containing protein [Erythrobacter sp.]